MQDYYSVPRDGLILEVGKDDWVYNPRESKDQNNLFIFLTWEDDGSPSPDENEYDTIEDLYNSLLHCTEPFNYVSLERAFGLNGYVCFPVCKDEWGYLYELKTEDHTRPIVGYLFQKADILKNKCRVKWQSKAKQELKFYNQYISRDVYFINAYKDGTIHSYRNNVYEKEKALAEYEDCHPLGYYDCIQDCIEDLKAKSKKSAEELGEKKPRKQSVLSKIYAIGQQH